MKVIEVDCCYNCPFKTTEVSTKQTGEMFVERCNLTKLRVFNATEIHDRCPLKDAE